MKRGEIWTLQDRSYASKARPVIIIQNNNCNSFDSVILCLLTSFDSSDVSTRVPITACRENGLVKNSYVMTDKIVTVRKDMLGEFIGVLSEEDMLRVSEQLRMVLDI